MKIYWTVKQVPGFRDLSKDDQNSVLKMAHIDIIKTWQTWVLILPIIVGIVFILPESLKSFRSGIAVLVALSITTLRTYKHIPDVMQRFQNQKNNWSALSASVPKNKS